jgi:hypothetical protein
MASRRYKTELKKEYMIMGIERRRLIGDDYDYKIYPEVEAAYYSYSASVRENCFDTKKEALEHAISSEYWQGTTFMIQKVYTLEIDWTHPLN